MFKGDAKEATPIVRVTLDALLSWTATRGRSGADLRSACNNIKVRAPVLLQADTIVFPLIKCFDLARVAGITLKQLDYVRQVAVEQRAVSVGAILTKNTLIELTLATAATIIANMTFVSRDDVERCKQMVNVAFAEIEEEIADSMDAMTWRALVKVHAAIVMHLYETARPLPRMLNFRFNFPMPTLVMAHKLYADAGRADELRNENKVVHPAFARQFGKALSA